MSHRRLIAASLSLLVASGAAAQDERVDAEDADPDRGFTIAMGGAGPGTACFTCHGIDGQGDSTGAFPRLAGQSAFYLDKQLQDYAEGSRPNDVMSPIAEALSDEDIRDVAAYYAGQEDVPFAPPPEPEPELLQRGGTLSAIGDRNRGIQACVDCHGPGGVGSPPNFPALAGQYAAYIELQLLEWKRGRRGNDPEGMMESIAQRMNDEDIRAVGLYFESVRPGHPEAERNVED